MGWCLAYTDFNDDPLLSLQTKRAELSTTTQGRSDACYMSQIPLLNTNKTIGDPFVLPSGLNDGNFDFCQTVVEGM